MSLLTELLHENFNDRVGLVVEFKNKKFAYRLKKYGYVHYVSNRMNYAILYVDKIDAEEIMKQIKNEKFVTDVSVSPKGSLPLEYDGVLDEMQKEVSSKKKEEEKTISF